VKINPLTAGQSILRLVSSKDDAQPRDEQRRQPRQQYPQNKKPSDLTDKELAEEIEKAVGSFAADEQTRASGLSATAEGTGPGLRIVLKDSSGSVVRQFTGEEFLDLRKASGKDSRARGKILDQKY
jgi:hypothetical protein